MTEALDENPILIVGAGPVGLALALDLHRRGVNYRIVDKSAGPADQSRALAIQARTLEIFENLGVVDQIVNAGHKLSAMNVNARGKQILHLSLSQLDSPYPYILSLPQSQTEAILIQALEKLGGKVERQVELVNVWQNAYSVQATLKHANSPTEEVTAGWLVACDGAHSTVRSCLNINFAGSQYPETWLLADVKIDTTLSEYEGYLFNSKDGVVGIFPYGHGKFRIVADIPVDDPIVNRDKAEGQNLLKSAAGMSEPTLEDIQSIVDKRTKLNMTLQDPKWLASFKIHARRVNNFRDGRIFLAGDAAHINSPAGGQGMNTGIQDANNLAWKFDLVRQGHAHSSLLDSYSTERLAVADGVIKFTDALTKINTLRSPVARLIRNFFAPGIAAQEVVQERLRNSLSELSVNYRESPIVSEYRIGLMRIGIRRHAQEQLPTVREWFAFDLGPNPGDRACDANLFDPRIGQATTLFQVLRGTAHHLLLLAGARSTTAGIRSLVEIGNYITDSYARLIKVHLIAADDEAWSEFAASGSHFSDPDLSCHLKYGASSECLYLIRPDGYIGFRSQPADNESLRTYLEQIFSVNRK
jgi:2-polyprenyl-6-methoxyphenol hydroxylase-like FAD-dependent oxidoreductase